MTPGKRLAARCAAFAVGIGLVSAAYQQIAENRDQRRFPPPGRMVNIGGRRLHLIEAGVGAPAVIVIPALGSNVLEWLPVVRKLASQTRICVYDRAGIGWSDPPRHERRSVDGMAADLHRMLGAAGIAPPYILAGHSLGGIIARRFITHYPGEVGGLLVIDSSHEDQMHQFAAEDWREGSVAARQALRRQARILGARRLAALLGLLRHLDAEVAREAPPEFADPARAIILSTRQRRTVVRELLMFSRLQGQSPDLGSLPLTVLTSAKGDRTWRGWPAWTRMQTELAALSSDSRHIHASKAGHYIHLDEPELVIQAVKYLLSRSG